MTFDVVVLGSGSAGLMAALTAATSGRRVLLLEKSDKLGGMTAYSGAGIWIPANHHATEAGLIDSQSEALAYIRAASPPEWSESEDVLWQAFIANAPAALEHIERNTPIRFSLVEGKDVFLDKPGAKAYGRMLSPKLLSRFRLGSQRAKLRTSVVPQLMTYGEAQHADPLTMSNLQALLWAPRLAWRLVCGYRGMGAALVIGLLQGLQRAGVQILTGARDVELLHNHGRVTGVACNVGDVREEFHADCGVVIATGGFEWNETLRQKYFPGPIDYLTSPCSNNGDAVRIAEKIGAALAHMDQANLNGAIPGKYEGRVQGIGWFLHHFPSAIVVDGSGKRFGNETDPNFFSLLNARDDDGTLQHSPAWLVSDASLFRKHRLARFISRVDQSWIVSATTIDGLANAIRLDSVALKETVDRFNQDFANGFDSTSDRKGMQPITQAPFVAVRCNRSFMSTKGGPRTNAQAQVVRPDGTAVAGLFCAGAAMANPIGTRAISSGTTLGPNLTWGYIAGKAAAAV